MSSKLAEVDKYLNICVAPVMMAMSVVGNFLAILVLSRKSFNTMPMSVYLRFLAVMDAGTVVTGLLPRFIVALTGYDVRGTNELSCQFQVYAAYVFTELSAWTLVIVTFERVLSIVKPHKVRIFCTKCKAYIILPLAVGVFLFFNSPIFFLFGPRTILENITQADLSTAAPSSHSEGGGSDFNSDSTNGSGSSSGSITAGVHRFIYNTRFRPCGFQNSSEDIIQAWFLLHFTKQSVLPFLTILTLNSIIIISLVRRSRTIFKITRQVSGDQSSANNGGSHVTSSHCVNGVHGLTLSRRDASLTLTLVTINTVFLISNFPIGIYQTINFNLYTDNPTESLIYSFLVVLLYTNNTLNFILYCLTGTRFRTELSSMCSRKEYHCNPHVDRRKGAQTQIPKDTRL